MLTGSGMSTHWSSLPRLINVLLCLFFFCLLFVLVFISLFISLFFVFCFVDCLFNWSTEMAVLTCMASSVLSNPMMSSPRYRIICQDGLEGIMLTGIQY